MDLEAIPSAVWGGLGAGSMMSLLYWLMATGRLIPASIVDRMMADLRHRVELQDQTIESLTSSTQKLTVNSDLTVQLLRSIDRTATENGGGA